MSDTSDSTLDLYDVYFTYDKEEIPVADPKRKIPVLTEQDLLQIFELLPVPDRKTCGLVCKLWRDITKVFSIAKDMVYVLDVDYILENFPKFYGTWRRFTPNLCHIEIQKVCSEEVLDKAKWNMIQDFLEQLGGETRVLTVSGCEGYLDSLSAFPKLEILIIPSLKLLKGMKDFPDTLKNICVKDINERTYPEVVKKLLYELPNLQKLIGVQLKHVCKKCEEKETSKNVKMEHLFYLSPEIIKAREFGNVCMENVNILQLKESVAVSQVSFQPNFGVCGDPKLLSEILELNVNDWIDKVKLGHEANPENPCWFRHEVIRFKRLKSCYLEHHTYCAECIDNFLQSCPDAVQFSTEEFGSEDMSRYVKEIICDRELNKLHVIEGTWFPLFKFISMEYRLLNLQDLQISIAGDQKKDFMQWPQMAKLRYLQIELNYFEHLEFIVEKCSGLREFYLKGSMSHLLLVQFINLPKAMPYLKCLKIDCEGYRFTSNEISGVASHWRELRRISIYGEFYKGQLVEKVEEKVKKELFEAIPTLRHVNLGSSDDSDDDDSEDE